MEKYIIAFYPDTLSSDQNFIHTKELVKALIERPINWVVIRSGIDSFCKKNDEILSVLSEPISLDRYKFLELLKKSDAIIGNSSASVIEAPCIGIPSILIGDRQKGRLMADSIIQAEPTKESIQAAFDKLYSKEFQDLMKTDYYMPYKGENVAEKMLAIIRERLPNIKMKKGFYDLPRF